MNGSKHKNPVRVGALTILALLVAFMAGAQAGRPAVAVGPGTGIQNPGFEEGMAPWVPAAPDAAVVLDHSEGPGQFAAYLNTPDGDITVAPYRGANMARLGTPKNVNSAQPSGLNSVSQTFTPSTATLSFAVWLFSWETRPNTDFASFSFKTANGTSVGSFQTFNLKKKDGTTIVTCTGTAVCNKVIDVGNNGDFLSSGWVPITVTGLPTDQAITFTASVGSTANNSKASWLYLDNANSPPVADFDFAFPTVSLSGGVAGTDPKGPLEGSPIQFKDKSTDPDGLPDKVVAWEWTVKGPGPDGLGGLSAPLLVQNPFFVPSNEGTFTVTLKVTDTFGATDTKTLPITVSNAPPLVNALNVEALAGKPFPLTGRFTDAGWEDTHTTSAWALTSVPTGATSAATVVEDHAPALGTGKVTGTVTAPGVTSGILQVTDSGGAFRKDPFTVNTLEDDSTLRGHTEFSTARAVNVDGSYLGVLPTAGARSVYEIKWPGSTGNRPQDLPGGSEVLVNLKDLPADYDVVLVTVPPAGTPATTGYAFSGFAFSGYAFSDLPNLVSPYSAGYAFSGSGTAGYAFSGLQRSAYGEAGYAFSAAQDAGYAFSGYAFSGYAFSGYAFSDSGFGSDAFAPYAVAGYAFSPISQMGFTGLQSSNTSPSDVSLSELGLGSIPAGTSVVGYSANRGLDGETVLARIDQPGTKLYAIVVGANGAHSADPFRLDVEGSTTITASALNSTNLDTKKAILSGPTCAPRTIASVLPTGAHSVIPSPVTPPPPPTTLFVTSEARLQDLNSGDNWNGFVASVQALAGDSKVNGKIISVDSPAYAVAAPAYAAWDLTPCSIEAANAVSDAVRARIQAELTANSTIQYVVILGDDDVVPFQRVPDQVSIGNERSYLSSSFLKQGTPLYASVAGGYNLTDDCNVDAQPTPWQGRELCIPDKVISRMVETPNEIAGQAAAFIASNGLLDGATEKTGFVSGYDFFTDGSEAVAHALEVFLSPVARLISDSWTATQLKCNLLGIGAGCVAPSIADANAHFTHYAGLSADGFKNGHFNDIVTSSDVKAAVAADLTRLAGKLIYTIGCHAGFSAPDNAIYYDPNIGVDARLDFAQAFAQANAVYIASTGYGIGDDSGIAGTERLMVLYAEQLAKGKSAGQALVDAKRAYLSALPAASVYDEKSSINLTLYGLPMYSLGLPLQAQSSSLTANVEALTAGTTSTQRFLFTPNTPNAGKYYSLVGGDAAAPPYRPLQPRQVIQLPTSNVPVHGALWTAGEFTEEINVNPVISRPSVEWEQDPAEPQVCYKGFWPSELFRVNTLDNAQGQLNQSIVVTPGQFRCDLPVGSPAGTTVTGTQRLFQSLTWETLSSDSKDVNPPSLTDLDMEPSGETAKPLTLKISALDPVVGTSPNFAPTSGISRIVVLRINAAASTATKTVYALSDTGDSLGGVASGTFNINIPNPGNDRLIIQIVDAAGNVGVYSAKGPGLRILSVDLVPDRLIFDNQPVTFTANVDPAGEALVTPVSYFWDFGDNTTATTTTSSISHIFSAAQLAYTVKVKVTDSNGGIGVDTVIVRSYCTDPMGDATSDPTVTVSQGDFIGCAVSKPASGKLKITLFTAGDLTSAGPDTFPAKLRYTINVAAGKNSATNLSYREGSWSGAKSLVVELKGNTISFTFDLKDVGGTAGKPLSWYATTQGGIAGTQGAGSLDRMKDTGTFSYTPTTP